MYVHSKDQAGTTTLKVCDLCSTIASRAMYYAAEAEHGVKADHAQYSPSILGYNDQITAPFGNSFQVYTMADLVLLWGLYTALHTYTGLVIL